MKLRKPKKKTIIILIILIAVYNIIGIKWARPVITPNGMPDIVFVNIIDYMETEEDDELEYAMTFYDKNGNHYTTEDKYICTLPADELVREYAAGNLDDKIEYHMSCDKGELFRNYKKLCRVSKNIFLDMEYPEEVPQVEDNKITWYGLYYDRLGRVQEIKIHEREYCTHFYTNDKRANELYEWYIGSFKKNK